MESIFEVLSEPHRRAIVGLLAGSPHSVGELESRLGLPQTTVSKHLRVLREAGFVESTADAQRRVYHLRPEPFRELDEWMVPFRQLWAFHLDALERHLNQMESPGGHHE